MNFIPLRRQYYQVRVNSPFFDKSEPFVFYTNTSEEIATIINGMRTYKFGRITTNIIRNMIYKPQTTCDKWKFIEIIKKKDGREWAKKINLKSKPLLDGPAS